MKKILFLLAVLCSVVANAQNPSKPEILNNIDTRIRNNPATLIRGNDLNRILKEMLNHPVDTIWIRQDTLFYRKNGFVYGRRFTVSGSTGNPGSVLRFQNRGQGINLFDLSVFADTARFKRISGDTTVNWAVLNDSTLFLSVDSGVVATVGRAQKMVNDSAAVKQAKILFKDESVDMGGFGDIRQVNFVGNGVTLNRSGDLLTVNITGLTEGSGDGNNFPVALNLAGDSLVLSRNGMGDLKILLNTTSVAEGSNQYFTLPRVRNALSADGPLVYDPLSGNFSILQANSTQDGYITGFDWNTFNTKNAGILFKDEDFDLGSAGTVNEINFTGSAVTATRQGNALNINFVDQNNRPLALSYVDSVLTLSIQGASPISASITPNNIYRNNGTLTGPRTLDFGGHTLTFGSLVSGISTQFGSATFKASNYVSPGIEDAFQLGAGTAQVRASAITLRGRMNADAQFILRPDSASMSRRISYTSNINGSLTPNSLTTRGYADSLFNQRHTLLSFMDEASALGSAGTVTELNFTGAGVTASRSGNRVDVVISGGGGGGGTGDNNYPTTLSFSGPTLTMGRNALSPLSTTLDTVGLFATRSWVYNIIDDGVADFVNGAPVTADSLLVPLNDSLLMLKSYRAGFGLVRAHVTDSTFGARVDTSVVATINYLNRVFSSGSTYVLNGDPIFSDTLVSALNDSDLVIKSFRFDGNITGVAPGATGSLLQRAFVTDSTFGFRMDTAALRSYVRAATQLFHNGAGRTSTLGDFNITGAFTLNDVPFIANRDTALIWDPIDRRVKRTRLGYQSEIAPGTTAQYYRGDKTWQDLNTAAVTETSNLYFTNTRARAAITLTSSGTSGTSTYNNATGVLNIPNYTLAGLGGEPLVTPGNVTQYYRGDKTWQILNTTAVTEGGNLYFTNARARSAISVSGLPLTYNASTGVIGINAANGSQSGFLTSTDWNLFSGKQNALQWAQGGSSVGTPGSFGQVNFTGTGVTVSDGGSGSLTVNIPGPTGTQYQDEGVAAGPAGAATTVNFTGVGVNAVYNAGVLTVNVPGGGGASDGNNFVSGVGFEAGGVFRLQRTGMADLTANLNTSLIPELTNLYFTNARARTAISLSASLGATPQYNAATGIITVPTYTLAFLGGEPVITPPFAARRYWTGYKTWGTLNTDSLNEGGTNLFYTNARARASVSLTTTGNTGAATYNAGTGVFNIPEYTLAGLGGEPVISAGTTAQYWRGDKSWQTLNTAAVAESGNLYFTNSRARLALSITTSGTSGAATYDNVNGIINVPSYTLGGLGGEPLISAPFATRRYWTGYKTWGVLTSDSLNEGSTNLFYTNARARLALSATGPLQYNNGTGVFSILTASGAQSGAISSTDWTTFNGKQQALQFQDEGSGIGTLGGVSGLNFTGGGVTATHNAGVVTINVPSAASVQYQDEGANQGAAGAVSTLDFTGPGVTATFNANKLTVAIAGGTGADGNYYPTTLTTANGLITIQRNTLSSISDSLSTTRVVEGSNLYFTNARARSAISLTLTGNSGASSYNSSTGVLNIPQYTLAGLGGEPIITAGTETQYWRGDKTWQTLNSTAVSEGTNLYFTNARARNAIALTTTGISGASTYDQSTGALNIPNYTLAGLGGEPVIGSGTSAQYWRGDKTWQTLNTTAVVEGSSLYFTNARARASISLTTTGSSGAATYNSGTGILNIPAYTLAGLGGEPIIGAGTTAQYWRGDKTWQTLNTTAVAEGTSLYFTNDRARQSFSLTAVGTSGPASYDNVNGVINVPNYTLAGLGGEPLVDAGTITQYYRGDKTWQALNTDAVTEGVNQYFTLGRARNAITLTTVGTSGAATYNPATGVLNIPDYNALSGGTVTQYLRGDRTWQTLNSTAVVEGTNLYFTNARARTALSVTTTGNSGPASYNSGTGVVNIPNYTLAGLNGEPAINAGTVTQYWRGDKTWQTLNSDAAVEGVSNLYFTNGRARTAISLTTTGASGPASYNNATGVLNVPQYTLAGLGGEPLISGGLSTQFWAGNKTWVTLNTSVVPESGANQYFSNARARSAVSATAPISFSSTTGVISITQAGTGSNGFLTSADWNLFNSKQAAIQFRDEGVSAGSLGAVTAIDFVGSGVSANFNAGVLTVSVTGGGGSTDNNNYLSNVFVSNGTMTFNRVGLSSLTAPVAHLAENGLGLLNGAVRLGGTLMQNTTVNTSSFNLGISGNGDLSFASTGAGLGTASVTADGDNAARLLTTNTNGESLVNADFSTVKLSRTTNSNATTNSVTVKGDGIDLLMNETSAVGGTFGGLRILNNADIQITRYPSTREDGTTTKALYVDASGNVKYGTVATGQTFGDNYHTLGAATFWNFAVSERQVREVVRIGESGSLENTFVLSAVFYIPTSSFSANSWVHCGNITDASYRPISTQIAAGPTVVPGFKFTNPGGTAFTGTGIFNGTTIRIDTDGRIFVYVTSVGASVQLSGVNYVMIPVNMTWVNPNFF